MIHRLATVLAGVASIVLSAGIAAGTTTTVPVDPDRPVHCQALGCPGSPPEPTTTTTSTTTTSTTTTSAPVPAALDTEARFTG